jgi:hypothetical protein
MTDYGDIEQKAPLYQLLYNDVIVNTTPRHAAFICRVWVVLTLFGR